MSIKTALLALLSVISLTQRY